MLNRRYLSTSQRSDDRRGIALVWAALVLVVAFAFVAFTVDIGHLAVTKTELQAAADATALGAISQLGLGEPAVIAEAKRIASANTAVDGSISLANSDIEFGKFNFSTKEFVFPSTTPNAIRVTARKVEQNLFFAPVLGQNKFSSQAKATAMLNPRDIVFAIDLSGSMNDDTEPCWATDAINTEFASAGYGSVANQLMQDVYDDFGFGTFPGAIRYLGDSLGVASNGYAYAEMTKDDGPLTKSTISAAHRINNSDDEGTRRAKAYAYVIENVIPVVMPSAPAESDQHWEAYLDYIISGSMVGVDPDPDGGGGGWDGGPSGPSPPPIGAVSPTPTNLFARTGGTGTEAGLFAVPSAPIGLAQDPTPGVPRRGSSTGWDWVPHKEYSHRIYEMNNPSSAFPSAWVPWGWRNHIGYVTYVQFMMDLGRDRSAHRGDGTSANPSFGNKSPLSLANPNCPRHPEVTAGGTFSFPPRAQPMHSVRRALIAGINLVQTRNAGVAIGMGDRVSIVTFDGRGPHHSPKVFLPLTDDYLAAMTACTNLQACGDIGATTATEAGLIVARDHASTKNSVNNPSNIATGPQGRAFASKVVVLLTDGRPNLWDSTGGEISTHISTNPNSNYYGPAYKWFNAPIMQAQQFRKQQRGTLFPVGMGLGSDYDFMDRLARIAATDKAGKSPRGSGNPAHYEARLTKTLSEIVNRPGSRLVE